MSYELNRYESFVPHKVQQIYWTLFSGVYGFSKLAMHVCATWFHETLGLDMIWIYSIFALNFIEFIQLSLTTVIGAQFYLF